MLKFFALIIFLGIGGAADAADFTTTCQSFKAPLTGGYCVHVPTGPRSRDVLYYFHGLDGSQAYWAEDFTTPPNFAPNGLSTANGSPRSWRFRLGRVGY